jgi:hypothetical protein
MRALPVIVLLAALGFLGGGLDGMAWGSVAGSACGLMGLYIDERRDVVRADAVSSVLHEIRGARREIGEAHAETHRVALAVLDALPVLHYDLLEMHSPRTQEQWEAVGPLKWPLIRRRLVAGYGVDASKVDAAHGHILDQHAAGHRLPRTLEDVEKLVDSWREAEAWAAMHVGGPLAGGRAPMA